MGKVTINHGSVYARVPQRAAEQLAEVIGGVARPFHPCEGAWVCFLSGEDQDWDGPLIEFYPRDVLLERTGGKLAFRVADGGAIANAVADADPILIAGANRKL